MIKIGRNKPCWCGSGKKFNICHHEMDKQPQINLYKYQEQRDKIFNEKYCIYPDNSKCKGKISKAHTIQRNGSLNRIAKKGHVYQFKSSAAELVKAFKKAPPKLIGTKKATTFTGFCETHDSEIFIPIEQSPFTATDEQCFLLAFRAISRELFIKRATVKTQPLQRNIDSDRDLFTQYFIQERCSILETSMSKGLEELQNIFDDHYKIYISNNFTKINYVSIFFDCVPELMFCGAISIDFDFKNQMIQDLADFNKPMEILTCNSFATDNGGAVVFSWLDNSHSVSSKFIQSLLEFPKDEIPNAIVRFCFEYCENVAFSPEWWQGLNNEKKETIIKRVWSYPRESGRLQSDGFDYVRWGIKDIKIKIAT